MQLINERPNSPRPDEIEAIVSRAVLSPMTTLTDAQVQLQKAIRECVAAEKALNEAGERTISELPEEQYKAADERFSAALKRVDDLANQLPVPSRSVADIALLAQVAWCHSDKDARGNLAGLSDDGAGDQAAAAQLITSVLEFADVDLH